MPSAIVPARSEAAFRPTGHRVPLVRVRRAECGATSWSLEPLHGRRGTPEALWCPYAARAEGTTLGATVDLTDVLAAWRHAAGDPRGSSRTRAARRVVAPEVTRWSLSPRDELFAGGGAWPHGLALAEAMLRDGAAVALTTRAGLMEAEGLVGLAERFGPSLGVRIGVFGASAEVEARWEPGLRPRSERLALAERLVAAGAEVEIELGPVVPFVSDDGRHWQATLRAAARAGVSRVIPRFLAGDWALVHRLERGLSPAEGRMVMGWLGLGRGPHAVGAPAERRGYGLSASARETRIARLQASLGPLPLTLSGCGCVIGGSRAQSCVTPSSCLVHQGRQGELFGARKGG